jgi:hypothetical protein
MKNDFQDLRVLSELLFWRHASYATRKASSPELYFDLKYSLNEILRFQKKEGNTECFSLSNFVTDGGKKKQIIICNGL